MPRNPDLLRRMYGDHGLEPRPEPVTFGVLPAFWIVGLLVAFAAALVVSVGSLVFAAMQPPPQLETWGVISADEGIVAAHDHSIGHDGTAGCAITGPRLVRWDEREITGSVVLKGADVALADGSVEAHQAHPKQDVICPFEPGEDAAAFAALARRWTR